MICEFGSGEHNRRVLPPIQTGDVYGVLGFSEPEAGSDLASLRTTAIRDNSGDGDFYELSAVDARMRELKQRLLEEKRER